MLYPLVFQPLFKDRVWGGRELERLYGKKLPAGKPIGESWEISDRSGDVSVIANGPLAGKDLRWLMMHHREEVLGHAKATAEGCFPLLCKVLDAREKLSLQVHPPANKAAELNGEPKTEMWYIADAAPDASLYVGLKRGGTRAQFEQKIADGTVADCFHRIPVRAGDTMFLPSSRVHAIGGGLVIFEIQQNSDTTYRVFDWNRVGLDGKPRQLHVPQSLASIDFNDFEPKLVTTEYQKVASIKFRHLVQDPLFDVDEIHCETADAAAFGNKLGIVAVLKGSLLITAGNSEAGVELNAGQFCLIPACLRGVSVQGNPKTAYIYVEAK